MKLTHLTIRNYAGIAAADIAVPPGGILIKGGNARGKTSILRALRAALLAQGLDPSCIHQGADKSEIFVDMETLHAHRTIRQGGKDLVVTGPSGDVRSKPQTILNELFGKEVDPLAFYLATDTERRRMIYAVMPMELKADDVFRWTGEHLSVPSTGHGLEVLAGIRQRYYDKRTTANAAAEESKRRADELRAKADAMGAPFSNVLVPEAAQLLQTAQRELNELTGRQVAYRQAREKAGPTREKIGRLHLEAQGEQRLPVQLKGVGDVDADSTNELEAFKQRLRAAFDSADAAIASVTRRRQYIEQIEELETYLANVDSMAVPQEELDAASRRVQDAAAALAQANLSRAYLDARAAADAARIQEVNDRDNAGALDKIVRTLTTDAPRELAERGHGFPGLTVDKAIMLDGVVLDDLSGKEQLQFAVNLAKRVRGEGRVLTVDGLEKLDEDELPGFLKMAVAGGWQCIATRVTRGQLSIEAISEGEE